MTVRGIAAMSLLIPALVLTGCATPTAHADAPAAIVRIRDLRFTPNTVKVHVGDTVEWEFDDDGLYHHVHADDGSFDSDIVGEGTFSVRFTEPGAHPYACSIHPYMTGTVIVSE